MHKGQTTRGVFYDLDVGTVQNELRTSSKDYEFLCFGRKMLVDIFKWTASYLVWYYIARYCKCFSSIHLKVLKIPIPLPFATPNLFGGIYD